jgi:hypothetical protein
MVSLEMITLDELLRDKQYREYFIKPPKLPAHYTPAMKPWKLYIMKKGEMKWRAHRFGTYKEAFEAFKKMRPVTQNAAINCPALAFLPPLKTVRVKGKFEVVRGKQKPVVKTIVWKPRIEADMADHHWCGHCRRPTIWRAVALGARRNGPVYLPEGETALRCTICGASERIINLRDPLSLQKWDTENRPFIATRVA